MITFSRLSNKGNLGNQLFQIASTIGIAEKNGRGYVFPHWQYSKYFENQLPTCSQDRSFETIKEKKFNYHEWNLGEKNYDLYGWIQSEKYFNSAKTKETFRLKKEFTEKLYHDYGFLFEKKTILISIRRGDFVNNPHFFQLSFKYYFLAIINNFPDWKTRNLIFASDNPEYCKYHFSFLKNARFLENLSPFEQIALGIKCDDFVISNSTFSWWVAWLGEKENSRIIRPLKNLRGMFAIQNDDSDYFPSRWICFDDKLHSLAGKYFSLILRGNVYSLIVNVKYEYNCLKKKMKTLVKKYLVFLHLRK